METGRAEVLAKQAVELGGDDVDGWILERFVPSALHDWPEWEVALRWEAERVKLLASAGSEGDFTFRNESFGKLDYDVLHDILAENGLYARMRELLDALLTELRTRHGVQRDEIDDVILEGGSTLLPEVRNVVLRGIGSQEAAGPAVSAAIRRLEARAALPRAASAAEVGVDTLPRAARAAGPDSRTLPRGSRAPSDQDTGNRIDRTPRED